MLVIILFVLTSCGTQEQSPVTIGALFPFTGGLSVYGEVAQRSAQIAVDEINAQGGINGRPLVLDYQDHQCSPKTAVSVFQQLRTTKNISIFTSVACSGTVIALAHMMESPPSLLLGTIVTTPAITNISPFVFRNWASDAHEADLLSREVISKNYRRIGILHEQTDYAAGLAKGLAQRVQGKGVELVMESYASDAVDVHTQLAKLKAADTDALFLSPQTVTSADLVLKQLSELEISADLLVNDNVIKMGELLSRYSTTLEGAIGGDYIVEQGPSAEEFKQRYVEAYGSDCPQMNVCLGVYDAIHLLAQGISDSGEDPDAVRAFLDDVTYEGISGRISFDEHNDRENTSYTLFIVKEGKAVPLIG